jgi:hypothetical protein
MRPHALFSIFILASVLASCSGIASQPPATLTVEPPTPTPEIFVALPNDLRAQDAARAALAQQLGIDAATITVRKIAETDWPDSCLGLTIRGQACKIASTPGYRIVLDVGGATYEVRTDASAETVLIAGRVDSTLGELPAVCQGIGQVTFYSPENGFCFAYPARFTLGETNPTTADLFGPALDDNLDALRASLHLEVQPLNPPQDLKSIVDDYLGQFQSMPVPEIVRSPMKLGGEPAERLEVVPGREGSRDVFMVQDGVLYHFMFMPSIRDFPKAAPDVEDLFMTVTSSFTFLPAAAGANTGPWRLD